MMQRTNPRGVRRIRYNGSASVKGRPTLPTLTELIYFSLVTPATPWEKIHYSDDIIIVRQEAHIERYSSLNRDALFEHLKGFEGPHTIVRCTAYVR